MSVNPTNHGQNYAPLLTIDNAAERIKMSRGWIKKAIRDNELDVVRFGRAVRIRPEDLDAYIRRKIEGTSQLLNRLQAEFTEQPIQAMQRVTFHDPRR